MGRGRFTCDSAAGVWGLELGIASFGVGVWVDVDALEELLGVGVFVEDRVQLSHLPYGQWMELRVQ